MGARFGNKQALIFLMIMLLSLLTLSRGSPRKMKGLGACDLLVIVPINRVTLAAEVGAAGIGEPVALEAAGWLVQDGSLQQSGVQQRLYMTVFTLRPQRRRARRRHPTFPSRSAR